MGGKWNHIVLICIFTITSESEHLSFFLLWELFVLIYPLPVFVWSFVLCLLVAPLYIQCILPCHVCMVKQFLPGYCLSFDYIYDIFICSEVFLFMWSNVILSCFGSYFRMLFPSLRLFSSRTIIGFFVCIVLI